MTKKQKAAAIEFFEKNREKLGLPKGSNVETLAKNIDTVNEELEIAKHEYEKVLSESEFMPLLMPTIEHFLISNMIRNGQYIIALRNANESLHAQLLALLEEKQAQKSQILCLGELLPKMKGH